MTDKYDIDGEDALYQITGGKNNDDEDQGEDILDEIVGGSSRTPKRQKIKQREPIMEDDLYAGFGDIDKEARSASPPSRSRNSHSNRHRSPSPEHAHKRSSAHASYRPQNSSSSSSRSPTRRSQPGNKNRSYSDLPSRRDTPDETRKQRNNYADSPTAAIIVSGLNWWTTDEDVKEPLTEAGVVDEIKELSFSEHKNNGKSKGECYLELKTAEAAKTAKQALDNHNFDGLAPKTHFCRAANPYKYIPKEQTSKNHKSASSYNTPYMQPPMSYPSMYDPMQMMQQYYQGNSMMGRGRASSNNMGSRSMYINPNFNPNFAGGYWPNHPS